MRGEADRGWRRRARLRWLALAPALAVLGCLPGFGRQPERPDALDKVTGMESWRVRPENLDEEWGDWYRDRVSWRREHREQRVERVRNVRVGRLLEQYPDGPSLQEVLPVLRSRAMQVPGRQAPVVEEGGEGAWSKVPVQSLDRTGGLDGDPAPPPDVDHRIR